MQEHSEQWWAKPVGDGRWVLMVGRRWRIPGQRWTAYEEAQRSAPMSACETLKVLRHHAALVPLPA